MKRHFLRNLTIGGGILLSLLCSDAWAGYVLAVQTEKTEGETDSGDKWSSASSCWNNTWKNANDVRVKQVAISNDVMYGAIPGNKFLSYWNASTNVLGSTDTATDADNMGYGVTTDDAGNIIYSGVVYTSRIYGIWVVKSSSSNGTVVDVSKNKYIDLSTYKTTLKYYGRTDYFHATGDIYNGNGALWFTDGFTVVKVPIVNGVSTTEVVYDIPDNASHVDTDPQLWWYQSRFRPYADGKYLFQNYKGLFDCTITGGAMTCTLIGTNAMSANIGYLKDQEILVYSECDVNSRDAKITVHNRTTGNKMISLYGLGWYEAPSYENINVWTELVKINENTLALYTYLPGAGHAKFLITASADGTALNATIAKRENSNLQDVSLSWNTPYLASSWTLQYRNRYVKNNETYYTSWSNLMEKTTDLSYTHSNVYWYNDIEGFYPTVVEYRLLYHYDDYVTQNGQKERQLTLTAEVTPQLLTQGIEWDLNEIVEYPGYQKVQLFWKKTGTGSAPKYFNIYRDGVKINPQPVQVLNYIDDKIPTGDHEYYIEAYFNNTTKATTTSLTKYVNPRDPMKTTYTIEKIYNYRIGSRTSSVDTMVNSRVPYSNLNYQTWYKQGVYWRGDWYLAQCHDHADYDGNTAGIIKLTADKAGILVEGAGSRIITGSKKLIDGTNVDISRDQNTGVALDDAGNIFVRYKGKSSTGTEPTGRRDLAYELGFGIVYLKGDGSYSTAIKVDLTKCNISDSYAVSNPTDGIYPGRVDYYCMKGDLSKAGGTATLYVSGSNAKRSNAITLTRSADGNSITASCATGSYTDITIPTTTGKTFGNGIENYAFPIQYLKEGETVDGVTSYINTYRGDYVHNVRSNGYFVINQNKTIESEIQKIIFETDSRKQNSGGCTIGFNDEIFIITPQSVYSQNTGNFIVCMGDRTEYQDGEPVVDPETNRDKMMTAVDADLSKPIPVAQYTQTETSAGADSDANGNWLYAVHGTIEGEMDVYDNLTNKNHDCVYIYQYIPGVRFAKYRLIPNNYFPPTPVSINITTRYAEDEYGTNTDITGFDGVVKWQRPIYDQVGGGNVNYTHYSYTLVITDKNGNVIDKREIAKDAAIEDANGYYTIEYPFDGENVQTYNGKDVVFMPNEDETAQSYYAYVTVNYHKISDTSEKRESEQTVSSDEAGYEGVGATGTVTVLKGKSTKVERDENNKPVTESSIYRIDVNVDEPQFGEKTEEPVSHYEIWVDKGDGKGYVQVTDFNLMQGEEGKYTPVTDGKIPGDYDFAANEAYSVTGSSSENNTTKSTLHFYEYGTPYEYGTEAPAEDINPADWKYKVVTVYASTTEGVENRDISQSLDSSMAATLSNVPTGIENVVAGDGLRLYPIPVNTLLTIDSPEAVETIVIYNNMGVVVKSINCGGEYSATVNVEELATGMYFVSVNNAAPVKIIKK